MNFLAIDVETANANFTRICQKGISEFKNCEVIGTKLINLGIAGFVVYVLLNIL